MTYLEYEPDSRKSDQQVESHKDEIELVRDLAKAYRGDLRPYCTNEPVADTRCKSRTTATNT